jgi:hypothetical protein
MREVYPDFLDRASSAPMAGGISAVGPVGPVTRARQMRQIPGRASALRALPMGSGPTAAARRARPVFRGGSLALAPIMRRAGTRATVSSQPGPRRARTGGLP